MAGEVLFEVILLVLMIVSIVGGVAEIAARVGAKAAQLAARILPVLAEEFPVLSELTGLRDVAEAERIAALEREAAAERAVAERKALKEESAAKTAAAMKYPYGIPPEEGARLTQAVRSSLQIEGRNIAIAETNINGQVEMLTGISGKASPPGTVPSPIDPLFITRNSGAMTRAFDSEVKILEDIAHDLPPNSQAIISLYTEREPCFSCQGVIQQFQRRFPGINLMITHGQ